VPIKEEIKISKIDRLINIIIIDETPRNWRLWRAFNRVLSSQNDLALRVYAALLERKKQTSSRDLAVLVDAPLYSVRRALGDLHELGLVSRERRERSHLAFEYWSVETPILGVLRLIPEKYFQEGYPKKDNG
jgi:hypothetical protein